MFSAAGIIIYKAFAPNIRMGTCIAIGFFITKRGLFSPQFAKGVSIISLNISLPALIFSSMVTAFSPSNGAAFGPLLLVAIIYMALGVLLAYIVKELLYVPKDFQYGIIVMGALSNWANLPIAVIQTVGQTAPFNPDTDIELGVAYVSIFVLVMNTSFFPLGLHKLCALDFKAENLARPDQAPLRERWRERIARARGALGYRSRRKGDEEADNYSGSSATAISGVASGVDRHVVSAVVLEPDQDHRMSMSSHGEGTENVGDLKVLSGDRYLGGGLPSRKTSRTPSFTSMLERTKSIPATAPVEAPHQDQACSSTSPGAPITSPCAVHDEKAGHTYHDPPTPEPSIHKTLFSRRFLNFIIGLFTPVSIAIIMGVVCGLVPALKALFMEVDGWSGTRIPYAPNGQAPLGIFLETADFLGAITIPSTLILLGVSFARLSVPKKFSELPIAAIITMAAVKMIVVPLFGIFFIQALRDHTTMFPRKDLIRTFTAILVSGTPAAVNQLVVTQLYNPEGTAHTLAAFLLLQYALMPIFSTILAAISLYIVEQPIS